MLIGYAYVTKCYFCFTGSRDNDAMSIILPLELISRVELGTQ